MRLMQDYATSYTANTTLNLLRANRVNVLPLPNRLTLIELSIFGMSSVHVGRLGDRALPM